MPIVYYVCWPEGERHWKFGTDRAAREFRRNQKQGWDMVISPREEDDEPTDIESGPETSDEQA